MRYSASGRLADELEDLLDAERRILLCGNLDAINRLTKQKTRILDSPHLKVNNAETLQRIRCKAQRNAVLLAAAMEGVKAAVARLGHLRKGPAPLDTYDCHGQRRRLGDQSIASGMEHKA